jgi:glyoxylase-like metal-dependent hydrolase (beta-lactamase superfamily II)
VDRILNEGDSIDLGKGLRLEVIHTPGHSKGSISLLLRDQGILFCGDAVPLSHEMPIYDDAAASVHSVEKLKAVEGINYLLASWDSPREGGFAYEALDKGLRWLQRIDDAVLKFDQPGPAGDPMAWCVRVLNELGLPPVLANPLVARSFQANVQAKAGRRTGPGPS